MLPEHKESADKTFQAACARLTPQQWYNQKQTSTNNFLSEKGITTTKSENAKKRPDITKEDYMSVSNCQCDYILLLT